MCRSTRRDTLEVSRGRTGKGEVRVVHAARDARRSVAETRRDGVRAGRVVRTRALQVGGRAHWIRTFGVTVPPAAMVLKEDGKKIVESDAAGKDRLKAILVEHKHHILPRCGPRVRNRPGADPEGWCRCASSSSASKGGRSENAKNALRDAKLALVIPPPREWTRRWPRLWRARSSRSCGWTRRRRDRFAGRFCSMIPESAAACGGQHSNPWWRRCDFTTARTRWSIARTPGAYLRTRSWFGRKAFSSEEGMTMVERARAELPHAQGGSNWIARACPRRESRAWRGGVRRGRGIDVRVH